MGVVKSHKAITTDLGNREILFKISDETQDRDEDILIASGCDFTNFSKNPQFLGFHDYGDFPFGKVKSYWVDHVAKAVFAIVYFPTVEELSTDPENAAEHAKKIDLTYCMYKTGMLSAVSIGFEPKEMSPNPNSKSGYGKIISKWELYEFSAVPVPANPNALAMGVKSGKITTEQAKAMEGFMPTKAGRRISSATQEILDKMGEHHETMKKGLDMMTMAHEGVLKCMKDLIGQDEPDDDGNDEMDDQTSDGEKSVKPVLTIF